jgi:hypothetical protein
MSEKKWQKGERSEKSKSGSAPEIRPTELTSSWWKVEEWLTLSIGRILPETVTRSRIIESTNLTTKQPKTSQSRSGREERKGATHIGSAPAIVTRSDGGWATSYEQFESDEYSEPASEKLSASFAISCTLSVMSLATVGSPDGDAGYEEADEVVLWREEEVAEESWAPREEAEEYLELGGRWGWEWMCEEVWSWPACCSASLAAVMAQRPKLKGREYKGLKGLDAELESSSDWCLLGSGSVHVLRWLSEGERRSDVTTPVVNLQMDLWSGEHNEILNKLLPKERQEERTRRTRRRELRD